MRPEKLFVTFGGGNLLWRWRARMLTRRVRNLGLFDQVVCLDDRTLDDLVPGFTDRHANLIRESARGFGQWLWKPAIVAQLLAVQRPRLVVYLDAGCDVGSSDASRAAWTDLMDRAWMDELMVFECEVPGAVEYAYTKADLLEFLQVSAADRNSQQAMAGAVAFANSGRSLSLTSRWHEIATCDEYHFLDDSPSELEEHPGFIAHRHDQSILSCLCKTTGVNLEPNPSGSDVRTDPVDRPFLTTRNQGFTSSYDQRVLARVERVVRRRLLPVKQRLRS